MAFKISNFARMSLAQSAALADTTIYVSADDALLLPALGVGDSAPAVIYDALYREVVYVTAVAVGGALTVTRGQEGTAARDWAAGVRIDHTPTAAAFNTMLEAAAQSAFSGSATNIDNDYTVDVGIGSLVPALTEGERATFVIPADNNDAVTLAFTNGSDTTPAKPVRHQDNQALQSGDFQGSWVADVRFSTANDAWMLLSDTSFQEHATQINDGPVPGVNRHPNGKLDFWNNGTSFATPVTNTETADGWIVQYDGTIGTFTVNRQAFTLGQGDVPGDPKYFIRWDHSSAGSGSTFRRFRVPIPGVNWRNGEQITRSIWLKADSPRNVTGRVVQHFGTGGGPSADVAVSSQVFGLTTNWQQFSVTLTLPSIAGKTLGSGDDDSVDLYLDLPVNTSMTIDIASADVRPGHLVGLQSDTFPVPWWLGGTGGSFRNAADFLDVLNILTEGNFAAWFLANFQDLSAIEALAGTSGILTKTAANAWALRNMAVGSAALTITNPAGVAGDPSYNVSTGLLNYHNDPMSIAELASITGNFGTAAFVADNTLVHLTGNETITGIKSFRGASATALMQWENTTTTHEMEPRFQSSGTVFEFVPSPSGTPDVTKGFGYDFVNARWYSETSLRVDGALLAAAGTLTDCALGALADPNTGINFPGSDQLDVVTGGAIAWSFTSARHFTAAGDFAVRTGAGSATAPAISNRNDTNTGMYFDGADGLFFATGGTVRLSISTALFTFALPIQAPIAVSSETTGTLSAVSANKQVNATGDITFNDGVFAANDRGEIYAGASARTITQDTGMTLRLDGTATTGNRTLAARGRLSWFAVSNSEIVVSGAGVT